MIELTSQNEALLQRLSEVEKESGESKPIKPTEHQDPSNRVPAKIRKPSSQGRNPNLISATLRRQAQTKIDPSNQNLLIQRSHRTDHQEPQVVRASQQSDAAAGTTKDPRTGGHPEASEGLKPISHVRISELPRGPSIAARQDSHYARGHLQKRKET